MSYSAMALFEHGDNIGVARLFRAIQDRLRDDHSVAITVESDPAINDTFVELRSGAWCMRIYSEPEPHVLEESREIAALYASGRSDQAAIAHCAYRVTIDCDDDPEMEYFHHYVIVLEVLESLGAVALFEPEGESFIDFS